MTAGGRPWWRSAVVYQIYPRSFQDSDGDGIGDLKGILQRVGYLADLGIDAVWISPIYPSPMADFGYDVADFTGIDPMFGTLADFDRLVEALHGRGIGVILDFVPNHTSIEHPWFRQARRSRDDAMRDWYIWRDPAPGGGPPNNWVSQAGGGGWTLDEASGQYYYHAFLADQPDLNWRNPAVRRAMQDVLRFWLDRGVDGFRADVLWHIGKDPLFRDDPMNPEFRQGDPPFKRLLPVHSADHPDALAYATELRAVLEAYPGDKVLIGELSLPLARLMEWYGPRLEGVHLPFNFALIWAGWSRPIWKAPALRALIEAYEGALPQGAWPNWVLGNHDQPRIASRLGAAAARAAMVLLLTLRGTPTIYYADELGHPEVEIPPDRVRDPFGINMPGTGQGRDPRRTPMPWDASAHGGFTSGEPWLPLAPGLSALGVAAQEADPGSMLRLTRDLLALRRAEPALSVGDWAPAEAPPEVLAFTRTHGSRRFLVAVNLGEAPAVLALPSPGRIALSTVRKRDAEEIPASTALAADEAVVVLLRS